MTRIKTRNAAVVVALVLLGCEPVNAPKLSWRRECVTPEVREYTLACLERAGRGGESEPEDWIRQCEYQAQRLTCPLEVGVVRVGVWLPCGTQQAQRLCEQAGWHPAGSTEEKETRR